MDCVVLAGGRPKPGHSLYPQTEGRQKALIDVAGRPMVSRVLEALLGSRSIDRVVVVGLDEMTLADARIATGAGLDGAEKLSGADSRVSLLDDRGTIIDNLYAGIDGLLGKWRAEAAAHATTEGIGPNDDSERRGEGDTTGSDARALPCNRLAAFCWSDIPLVTPQMVDRFVEAAAPDTDIHAGLVARADLEVRYPGVDDLWLGFREGDFIAADFGVFRPAAAAGIRGHLEALAPHRKSAARQALAVGLPLLVRYLLRRLTIPYLQAHLAKRYGIRCRIDVVADPELGLDVDDAEKLELCRRALGEGGEG